MKKKRSGILVVFLVLLFVIFLGGGIYFLLQSKKSTTYNIDKYPDTANWCDTTTSDNSLIIDCQSLLLDITTPEENNTCFNVQVMTKSDGLKDLSICEANDTITYTNEVLEYKKLMPIDMIFTYTKENLLSNYIFTSVSITKLDDSYIQSIVNEDIADLITADSSTTTIQNSVDFCPNPEALPTYISEDNKNKYSDFYSNNILSEQEYINLYTEEFSNVFLENWVDPTIRILFGCESSTRLGYSTICKSTLGNEYKNVELSVLPSFVSDWSNYTNTESDLISLKNISLTLDGMQYSHSHANYASTIVVGNLFKYIYDANNNQNVYCSEYKIHEKLAQYLTNSATQLDQIRTSVITNISKASSMCLDILDKNLYSKEGIYLESLQRENSTELEIYQRCNNLYLLMSNE